MLLHLSSNNLTGCDVVLLTISQLNTRLNYRVGLAYISLASVMKSSHDVLHKILVPRSVASYLCATYGMQGERNEQK